MTNKECSICGNVETNKMSNMFELENGKLICGKCYEKMSESEKENLNSELKTENGALSQNNIDALLTWGGTVFKEELPKVLNSPEWKENIAEIEEELKRMGKQKPTA